MTSLRGDISARLLFFAVLGAIVFLALHLHFAANWEEYVVSPGQGYRNAIKEGSIEPYMGHSPRSTWVGQVVIFGAVLIVGLVSGRHMMLAPLAFWIGLYAVQLSILIFATRFPENLGRSP